VTKADQYAAAADSTTSRPREACALVAVAEYALTCSCGYTALRPTLGQAAAELLRHVERNDVDQHAVTIDRRLLLTPVRRPRDRTR
jgi:hypothetical protein